MQRSFITDRYVAESYSPQGAVNTGMNMHSKSINHGSNLLLASFSPECRAFLEERMLTKPIVPGEVLYEPNTPLQNLIFPHEGLISFQATLQDNRTIEKWVVGKEGFASVAWLFGETRFPCHAVALLSGRASWLSVSDFSIAAEKFQCVRPLLSAYAMQVFKQLMQAVVCANLHTASQRIATWLLHADDRSQASSFDLTQKTLASIFGLRLATVNDACSKLVAAGAIDHSRGTIHIVSRTLLEAQACECYESTRLHL